jgi:hypothetical protein
MYLISETALSRCCNDKDIHILTADSDVFLRAVSTSSSMISMSNPLVSMSTSVVLWEQTVEAQVLIEVILSNIDKTISLTAQLSEG